MARKLDLRSLAIDRLPADIRKAVRETGFCHAADIALYWLSKGMLHDEVLNRLRDKRDHLSADIEIPSCQKKQIT